MALTLGGIIGACGLFCGFLSWVLMCPGHPRDPEEDMEQIWEVKWTFFQRFQMTKC